MDKKKLAGLVTAALKMLFPDMPLKFARLTDKTCNIYKGLIGRPLKKSRLNRK